MRFNDDGTTPTEDRVTVKSAPVSRQPLGRSWLTVWPIFFMVLGSVWELIGQVRPPTAGLITPSQAPQRQLTHINTNEEDMQRKPVRTRNNRMTELIGQSPYFWRCNKWWCAESTHYPMTFLLDHLKKHWKPLQLLISMRTQGHIGRRTTVHIIR